MKVEVYEQQKVSIYGVTFDMVKKVKEEEANITESDAEHMNDGERVYRITNADDSLIFINGGRGNLLFPTPTPITKLTVVNSAEQENAITEYPLENTLLFKGDVELSEKVELVTFWGNGNVKIVTKTEKEQSKPKIESKKKQKNARTKRTRKRRKTKGKSIRKG
ncbi:hypothetical protein HS7_17770 [Sulfolobales archaeon HS-7]|nr:hypothetical protein HS7_17770 [Sulfolobales archaeon HS-7]